MSLLPAPFMPPILTGISYRAYPLNYKIIYFIRVLPFSSPAWPVRRKSLFVFSLGKGGLPASGVKAQQMSPRGLSFGPRHWLYTVACSVLTAAVTATVFSLSYDESPASPVPASDADGDSYRAYPLN